VLDLGLDERLFTTERDRADLIVRAIKSIGLVGMPARDAADQ